MYCILIYLFLLIIVLIFIVFYTLMEQKLMSLLHIRMGPNKNSLGGILQPLMDSIKLFSKYIYLIYSLNFLMMYFILFLGLLINLMLWMFFMNYNQMMFNMNFSLFSLMFIMSFEIIYSIMLGWVSSSIYSIIGSFRACLQTISYEINFYFIIFMFINFYFTFNLELMNMFFFNKLILMQMHFFIIMLIMLLVECNRTPFDFMEAESELVSGSNTDLLGTILSYFFILEYSLIIFMSWIFSFFLFSYYNMLIFLFILYLILLIRLLFPRFRYDFMMKMLWKIIMYLNMFNMLIMMLMMN